MWYQIYPGALNNNGSPAPVFVIDEPDRRYFVIEIKIHPYFLEDISSQIDDEGGQISGQINDLTERQQEIFILIQGNPRKWSVSSN